MPQFYFTLHYFPLFFSFYFVQLIVVVLIVIKHVYNLSMSSEGPEINLKSL